MDAVLTKLKMGRKLTMKDAGTAIRCVLFWCAVGYVSYWVADLPVMKKTVELCMKEQVR